MSTLTLSLGVVEVAILISSVLYGVTTLQAWLYAERFSNDPLYVRTAAGLVWVFETFHAVFSWIFLYWMTVTKYGDPTSVDDPHWSLVASVPFTFLIVFMVHIFFANRVRLFSGNLAIALLAGIGAVLHLGTGIALTTLLAGSDTISHFLTWRWLSTLQFALSACIDILNTSALCFYLSCRWAGVKQTQRILDKLLLCTVETGLITTVCAVLTVIAYFVWPKTYVNFALFMIYPTLFSNSFFASLNARRSVRLETETGTTNILSTVILPQSWFDAGENNVSLPASP